MKYLVWLVFFSLASTSAFADHHELNLEAKQSRTELDITSIQLGEDLSIVTAEGETGEYGRVYVTYYLNYDRDGSGGSFTMQGRGYVDTDTIFSGSGSGRWTRDGHLVRLTQILTISDGSQNLDVIVIDPLNRTLIADLYALRN
tara:strand:- start:737 stop:1168 length:432 start_codon:yes stop_codon:yes gene_type:complete